MLGTHVTLFFSREVWRYVSFGMLVPILRGCVTNRNGVAIWQPLWVKLFNTGNRHFLQLTCKKLPFHHHPYLTKKCVFAFLGSNLLPVWVRHGGKKKIHK